ncbi:MAG TPA: peptidoglycan DD-metalloendopeptidase family protein [Anaerolineales bacterium]|nr:peptidoglycan DD-metalloendopeptidase family protein [Anaerolineales bacterium]
MTMRSAWAALSCALVLAACGGQAAPTPVAPVPSPTQTVGPFLSEATSSAPPAPDGPTPTPQRFEFPTEAAAPVLAWRPPPYPVPWSLRPEDHFFFGRPIPSGEVNWPSGRYRYGGTFFGEESTHTGVDIGAGRGTPVLAAGPGEVVWTGYGLYRGLPDRTDPYGLAIAIRHDFGYGGKVLYTVYAHLASAMTWLGQRVQSGDQIGTVGETGHASGAHLHFEVRLGANDYFSTRNPELWVVSPEGWGVLAGRITNSGGRNLHEQLVRVRNLDTGQEWEAYSYAEGAIKPDETLQENFVLGDLPAGPYEVRIDYLGRALTTSFILHPGQTNFIVFRGRFGFVVEPTPTPPPGRFPPTS